MTGVVWATHGLFVLPKVVGVAKPPPAKCESAALLTSQALAHWEVLRPPPRPARPGIKP